MLLFERNLCPASATFQLQQKFIEEEGVMRMLISDGGYRQVPELPDYDRTEREDGGERLWVSAGTVDYGHGFSDSYGMRVIEESPSSVGFGNSKTEYVAARRQGH